jgi:putative tricarboxylic transport membrane protein
MGAWLGGASMGDWISCTVFGLLGFVMKRGGWPRPPVVLALVLGGILESSFQISMRIHHGAGWLGRPIVMLIMLVIVVATVLGWRRLLKQKHSPASTEGETGGPNPVISIPIALALSVLFIWAGLESLDWPKSVKQLPILVTSLGGLFSLAVLLQDSRRLRMASKRFSSWQATVAEGWRRGSMPEATRFMAYLVAMILLTLLVGQKIALPFLLVMYLRRWGNYSLRLSLAYGLVGWLVIVGFYDGIMEQTFYTSWLGQKMQTLVSGRWLFWVFN